MSRIKDELFNQEPPPEDEGLFEPGGGVECPEMDDNSIYEDFIYEPESVPF
jgi:hypothetical protein